MSTTTSIPEKLTTAEVKEITARYTYGTWRKQKGWSPLHVVDAEDCHFVDGAGKRYLDFSSQLMCVTLGHKNRAVIQAIQDQAAKLAFVGPGFATEIRAELKTRLLEALLIGRDKFSFTNSAHEDTESALNSASMACG